jgi:hypothetical protein
MATYPRTGFLLSLATLSNNREKYFPKPIDKPVVFVLQHSTWMTKGFQPNQEN